MKLLHSHNICFTSLVLIILTIYGPENVESVECCDNVGGTADCPGCGEGLQKVCNRAPGVPTCEGSCGCRTADECRGFYECRGKVAKCKGTKKPYMNCRFVKDDSNHVIGRCTCEANQPCKSNSGCLEHCKSGETGICEGYKCTCVKDIGGGDSCTNEECDEIRKRRLDECIKKAQLAHGAQIAEDCANKANICYDKCVANHKCQREQEKAKISFIPGCAKS